MNEVTGKISRRILINYKADPKVVRKIVPSQFELDLVDGNAMVGICLLSLSKVRPKSIDFGIGISSDNAAHRIAVVRNGKHGVYIPRRDTGSIFNKLAGGRMFPGEHFLSRIDINDDGNNVSISITNQKTKVASVHGKSGSFVSGSVFGNMECASDFYQNGSMGYSPSLDGKRLDGLELKTQNWSVAGFEIESKYSYLYDDVSVFPDDSIELDNALIMRNIDHDWKSLDSVKNEQ